MKSAQHFLHTLGYIFREERIICGKLGDEMIDATCIEVGVQSMLFIDVIDGKSFRRKGGIEVEMMCGGLIIHHDCFS